MSAKQGIDRLTDTPRTARWSIAAFGIVGAACFGTLSIQVDPVLIQLHRPFSITALSLRIETRHGHL
jgi:hypothetical protein